MNRPIEILMEEHRLIERVLSALQLFTAGFNTGTASERQQVADFAEFFRGFADRCHHGKEEDILFVALTGHGMPTDTGPLRVMLEEHDLGRACVRELAAVGEGSGEVSTEDCERVRKAAASFVPLLRAHIQKEDGILFQMALQHLPAEVFEQMEKQFEEFAQREAAEGTQERLVTLADSLIDSVTGATK